jgi:hypothetical protein
MTLPKTQRGLAVRVKPLVRHPFAVAWGDWIGGDEGKSCSAPTTLNAPAMQAHYLENRMHRAFAAGWRAAQKANTTEHRQGARQGGSNE